MDALCWTGMGSCWYPGVPDALRWMEGGSGAELW